MPCSPANRIRIANAPTKRRTLAITTVATARLDSLSQRTWFRERRSSLGKPQDLETALPFLTDPAWTFATAIVVPVDGGSLAFSGV